MASPIYRGFSTVNRYKKYRLTDFDLAKQDLFNHLNIRKGEKLGHPNFGSIIWGLLFEPLTDEVKDAVIDDLTTVVNYDPRLQLDNINIAEYESGLQVMLDLTFIDTNQTSTLNLTFDRGSSNL